MRDFNSQKWRQAVIGLLVFQYIFCEMSCNAPPSLEHGTVLELVETRPTTFPLGFEVTYVCDEGYRILSGRRRSRCGRRGWTGKTPRCEVIECPDPGVPENGETLGTDYRMGSKVSFICYPGFELLGSSQVECLPRGQWSDEPARCNKPTVNYCPDPGAPIGGWKNATEYGRLHRVGFRCQTGYILVGSEVRECLQNRTWSGVETRCIGPEEFDGEWQAAEMMKVKELGEKERTRNISSSGTPGLLDSFPGRTVLFFAVDVSRSLTSHDFKKGIAFSKEIVKRVGISVNGPRAGALTFSSAVELQFSPVTYNSTASVLTALDKIEFRVRRGGGTDVNSVLREIREDSIPRVRSVLGEKRTKSVIFLLTDGKVNRGGDPGREANRLKAQGARIFCIGVTADVRKRTLDRIASISRVGQDTRTNVFVFSEYTPLNLVVQKIAGGTLHLPALTLRAHSENNIWGQVLNVSCSSDENGHQVYFSRLLDTGTGWALPTAAQTYTRGRVAVLDLSGVPDGDRRGVFQCRQVNRTRMTFVINLVGQFQRPKVVSVGDMVRLDYVAYESPSLRWQHDRQPVPVWDGRGMVEIADVGKEDAGVYERYEERFRKESQRFYRIVVRGCPAGLFGQGCHQKCAACYNGGVCHEKLGTCICPPGFKGQRCKEASEACDGGDCLSQIFCQQDPYGCSCAAGYWGYHCYKRCQPGRFGADCKEICRCKEGSCDPYTGACSGGCSEGWTGASCQIPDEL